MAKKLFLLSFVTYTSISLATASGFLGAAKAIGGYPEVAIYGGAAWVFLLSMIVTMPLVTARVKSWQGSGR